MSDMLRTLAATLRACDASAAAPQRPAPALANPRAEQHKPVPQQHHRQPYLDRPHPLSHQHSPPRAPAPVSPPINKPPAPLPPSRPRSPTAPAPEQPPHAAAALGTAGLLSGGTGESRRPLPVRAGAGTEPSGGGSPEVALGAASRRGAVPRPPSPPAPGIESVPVEVRRLEQLAAPRPRSPASWSADPLSGLGGNPRGVIAKIPEGGSPRKAAQPVRGPAATKAPLQVSGVASGTRSPDLSSPRPVALDEASIAASGGGGSGGTTRGSHMAHGAPPGPAAAPAAEPVAAVATPTEAALATEPVGDQAEAAQLLVQLLLAGMADACLERIGTGPAAVAVPPAPAAPLVAPPAPAPLPLPTAPALPATSAAAGSRSPIRPLPEDFLALLDALPEQAARVQTEGAGFAALPDGAGGVAAVGSAQSAAAAARALVAFHEALAHGEGSRVGLEAGVLAAIPGAEQLLRSWEPTRASGDSVSSLSWLTSAPDHFGTA